MTQFEKDGGKAIAKTDSMDTTLWDLTQIWTGIYLRKNGIKFGIIHFYTRNKLLISNKNLKNNIARSSDTLIITIELANHCCF